MKRLILFVLVITCYNVPLYAIFGLAKDIELNAVKVDVAKQADAVLKANIDIGKNMSSLADINLRVGNIETKLNLQGNAIAGFNNKVSNISAGRDNNQSTVNSDEVVTKMLLTYKYIIGLLIIQLVGLASGLVIQMIVLIKYIASLFQAQIIEKDKMVDRERASRDDKDRKADEWKERYIESISGHKTNGLTPGQVTANEILVETLKDEAKQGG